MIGLARLIAPNRISCSSYLSKQRNRRLFLCFEILPCSPFKKEGKHGRRSRRTMRCGWARAWTRRNFDLQKPIPVQKMENDPALLETNAHRVDPNNFRMMLEECTRLELVRVGTQVP